MPTCAASGCSNRTHGKRYAQGLSFHQFPKDAALRNAWVSAVCRENWSPSPSSVLCSRHFEEQHIDRSIFKFVRLRKNAVPSIFHLENRKEPVDNSPSGAHSDSSNAVHNNDNPPSAAGADLSAHASKQDLPKKVPSCPQIHRGPVDNSLCGEHSYSSNAVHNNDNPSSAAGADLPIIVPSCPQIHQEPMDISPSTGNLDLLSPSCDDLTLRRKIPKSPRRREPAMDEETPREKKLRRELLLCSNSLSRTQKKVKNLQQSKRRLSKRVTTLQNVIKTMKSGKFIDDEQCVLLSGISEISQCLLQRQGKKASKSKRQKKYDEVIRAFAITLHYLSPSAYSFVRKSFDTCLPHVKTISRWYKSVNGNPGFSSEVFNVLKDRSTLCQSIGALTIDAMAIRQHMEWDGHRFHGLVNIGVDNDDDAAPLATEALVFHLVFINELWQVPIGYFLIDGASGHQLCGLVKQGMALLHDVNVRVVSLTCNGTASNISMANELGCNISYENLKTHFPHPVSGEPVNFFLDPCHMLKLVRNTLVDKKLFKDVDNNIIAWEYIEKVNELQNKEGFHLDKKLSNAHINYHKQKIKVRLASLTFSDSIADAIVYCKANNIKGFEGAAPTAHCIHTFNRLFDILNSRTIFSKHDKQALNIDNIERTKSFIQEAEYYIRNLKDSSGKLLVTTNRKTGFLGFLTCMQSTCLLYDILVGDSSSKYPLKYLPTYKISQDHLERLFVYIRSRGGHDNPTSKQFSASYKRILMHSELHESKNGNCLPLDKINMNVASTSSPVKAINKTLARYRLLEDEEEDAPPLERIPEDISDYDYVIISGINDTTNVTSDITEYIAGVIVRRIERKIMCEECSDALQSTVPNEYSPIGIQNKGGLTKPAADVHVICNFCEKVFHCQLRDRKIISTKDKLIALAIMQVIKMCRGMDLFPHFSSHFLEHLLPHENHFVLLIQAIAKIYFKVRLRHYTKQFNFDMHVKKIRSHFTKLVGSDEL